MYYIYNTLTEIKRALLEDFSNDTGSMSLALDPDQKIQLYIIKDNQCVKEYDVHPWCKFFINKDYEAYYDDHE